MRLREFANFRKTEGIGFVPIIPSLQWWNFMYLKDLQIGGDGHDRKTFWKRAVDSMATQIRLQVGKNENRI